MRLPAIAILLITLVACATGGSTRPSEVAAADVGVRLAAPIFFGSGRFTTASFDVAVKNQATTPISVRRIRLSTPGMVEYTIRPTERTFNETLAPGEVKAFSIVANAVAAGAGLTPAEPMTVRTEIDFEAGGRRYREMFNTLNVLP